jgi:biofilm PGA synthesis N-glycosyltransferase PgaC
VLAALAWAVFSTWLSFGWVYDLEHALGLPGAIAVVVGIAILPGYLNLHLAASLVLDRPRPLRFDLAFPRLALVIAARNEEHGIAEALRYSLRQDYPGELEVVVVDDGSTDGTPGVVRRLASEDPRIRLVSVPHGGKARALNAALETVDAPLVATIDADTLLMPFALRRAVARLLVSPPDTVAVAGAVLVRNSRAGLLARVQEWDYFLGIASVKRQQALLQGTLVAQGAFSVYDLRALRRVGGWPDRIGEDIVLTWAMIRDGGRTTFEPTAVAFTEAPMTLRRFLRQRQRWARGMIEGLRDHGFGLLRQRRLRAHSVATNFLFPYLDGVYTCAFLPGVALALAGNFAVVGPLTLAVLPLSTLVAAIMFFRQRQAFQEVGLRIRRNRLAFLLYLVLYPAVLAPVSFIGYLKELARTKRNW